MACMLTSELFVATLDDCVDINLTSSKVLK